MYLSIVLAPDRKMCERGSCRKLVVQSRMLRNLSATNQGDLRAMIDISCDEAPVKV